MSSVTWYKAPDSETAKKYDDNKGFFGAERTDSKQTQLLTNLPSIASGLNASVKNRYLMPIASTTISASNGKLHNSYGYSD